MIKVIGVRFRTAGKMEDEKSIYLGNWKVWKKGIASCQNRVLFHRGIY